MTPRRAVQRRRVVALVRRTHLARGHQPRLGPQPTGQQERLGEVFPPQQATGHEPHRTVVAEHRAQPAPRPTHLHHRRTLRRRRRIRQPAGAPPQKFPQHGRIRMIDRRVPHASRSRQDRIRNRRQRPKPRAPHLRPAGPAVVEPPVVLVQHQRNAMRRTHGRQRLRDQEVSSEPEIVRPHQRATRRHAAQDTFERRPDSSRCECRPQALLGDIAQRGIDRRDDRHLTHRAAHALEPAGIGRLATGQHDLRHPRSQRGHEPGQRQLDDPPHPARAVMTVHDHESQAGNVVAAHGPRDFFFRPGYPSYPLQTCKSPRPFLPSRPGAPSCATCATP